MIDTIIAILIAYTIIKMIGVIFRKAKGGVSLLLEILLSPLSPMDRKEYDKKKWLKVKGGRDYYKGKWL